MSAVRAADWLPPALREAPDGPDPATAPARRAAGRDRSPARAARGRHRPGLRGLLHRELRRVGDPVHRRARRPACRRRSRRGRQRRRAAAPQGHACRARGLRRGADRLDGEGDRGLAGHVVGAAARPPAAAARRCRRPARPLAPPPRDAVRARPPQRHAVGPPQPAHRDRAAVAVAAAHLPTSSRPPPSATAATRCTRSTSSAPLYRTPAPASARHPHRRASSTHRCAAATACSRRSARSTYGDRWRLAPDHPAARRRADLADRRQRPGAAGRRSASAASPAAARRRPRLRPGRSSSTSRAGACRWARASPVGVRATFHRPVSGRLGALAGDAPADVGARVVVTVDRDATPGPTVVTTLQAAIERAEQLCQDDPDLRPEDSLPGRPDVEIRLATSDRLPPPTAASFTPKLPRWRIVAPALMAPTIGGDAQPRPRGRERDTRGLLPASATSSWAPASTRSSCVNLTMNPVAGRSILVNPDAWALALARAPLPARPDPGRPRRARHSPHRLRRRRPRPRARRVRRTLAGRRRHRRGRRARALRARPRGRRRHVRRAGERGDRAGRRLRVRRRHRGRPRRRGLPAPLLPRAAAAAAPDDLPLPHRAGPALRLRALRGRRLLRARPRGRPPAADRGERRRRGRRLPPRAPGRGPAPPAPPHPRVRAARPARRSVELAPWEER